MDFKFGRLYDGRQVMAATHGQEISIWSLRNMRMLARKTIFPLCKFKEHSLVFLEREDRLMVLDSVKQKVLSVPLRSLNN